MHKLFFPAIGLCLLLTACNRKPEEMTGPTIGSQRILADESCRYIIEQEEEIFERTYKYAHLDIEYAPELDIIRRFLRDSMPAIMTTRPLTAEEKAFCQNNYATPREFRYATGAIAFVKNRNARDTAYVYEDLLKLFGDEKSGAVFVLENARSGIATTLLRLLNTDRLPAHFYALPDKTAVLQYVEAHDQAIGIIDYSDISDSDRPYTREVLQKVQMLGITRPVDSIQAGFVKPYQYNLQDRKYPFTRDLYFISQSGKSDVGIGFASFVCGDIGQKIILKSGLLPAFQSERIIEIKPSEDIKVVK